MTKIMPKSSVVSAASGPHANSDLCKFLNQRARAVAHVKGPQEIALEMGYSRPNYLLMILNGDTKLPLDKVQALAKALQVDPKFLFVLALEAQSPELLECFTKIFGEAVCFPDRCGE